MVLRFRKEKSKKNKVGRKKKLRKKNSVYTFTCSSFRVVPSNYQHIGLRENQEDAFAFSDLEDAELVEDCGVLAVVADGMGGLDRGEEASSVAVDSFLREYVSKEPHESISQSLTRALKASNAAVVDLTAQKDLSDNVGTTLAAAVIFQDSLHWISVGDSRVYHLRNGQICSLSKDHIYANHLLEDVLNDKLTQSEAENHPERGYLTSYLGLHEMPEIDRSEEAFPLQPGDAVMICSDGLYNALSDEEITEILQSSSVHSAELLVECALSKKKRHQDNITVVVLFCMPS